VGAEPAKETRTWNPARLKGVYAISEQMARRTSWIISVLIVVIVGAATLILLTSPKQSLSLPELKLSLPLPPLQPTTATVECSRGLVVELAGISGDWSVIQDHPPCTVGGFVLIPVKATATEMIDLNRRPRVIFKVAADGQVIHVSLSRTSGSRTFDEKALEQAIERRYRRHNCGVCKVSALVDVDFHGPVWMRESMP
jgi:hypothetical protein